MNKIRPIFRLVGSKYKMLDLLLPHFENTEHFIDAFGGTGVVAFNVLENITGIKQVTLNDYDDLYESDGRILWHKVLYNQLHYDGIGAITKAAVLKVAKMIKNGLEERVKANHDWIISNHNRLNIVSKSFDKVINDVIKWNKKANLKTTLYLDPPYKKGVYKGDVSVKFVWYKAHHALEYFHKVVISYEKTPEVLDIFKDWNIEEHKCTNTAGRARTRKRRTELIIWKKNPEWRD